MHACGARLARVLSCCLLQVAVVVQSKNEFPVVGLKLVCAERPCLFVLAVPCVVWLHTQLHTRERVISLSRKGSQSGRQVLWLGR